MVSDLFKAPVKIHVLQFKKRSQNKEKFNTGRKPQPGQKNVRPVQSDGEPPERATCMFFVVLNGRLRCPGCAGQEG
jgi:hypothetical protein